MAEGDTRRIFERLDQMGQEFVHVDMRDNGNSTGVYLWDDQE